MTNTLRYRPEPAEAVNELTIINAVPMLDNPYPPLATSSSNMGVSKAIAVAGALLSGALPTVLTWGLTIGLIFGGCCSNVSKYGRGLKQHILTTRAE